ncbi:MAG TPA: M42 family metallopeptidase [Anaerolineae bacterium]|nr:M42 family metallopeptidase [Anaerolineae bacterium]
MKTLLVELLNTPSPSGFTDAAMKLIEEALTELGLKPRLSEKGFLTADWKGKQRSAPRALTAHVDTLGTMVKEIKGNGRLKLSKIGGFAWNTVEGEGCHVHTASGETIRGSLLHTKASVHIFGTGVGEDARDDDNMEIRLDERTSSAEETRDLGIEVGDLVSFDPRVEISESGFIRSRHLDDKSGVACILAAVKAMKDAGIQPAQHTLLHFSNYEEVGHGAAAGILPGAVELVAVDMAVVGEGQTSDEFHTTICAKDSRGPYHPQLTKQLRQLAIDNVIPHVVDIYPQYGSDAEAYWRAGGSARIALIGPGVDASHNYERTHMDALVATVRLLAAYLGS